MSLVCFEILFLTLVERVKVIGLNNNNRSARKIAEELEKPRFPSTYTCISFLF